MAPATLLSLRFMNPAAHGLGGVSLTSPLLAHSLAITAVLAIVVTGVLAYLRTRPGSRRRSRIFLAFVIVALLGSDLLTFSALAARANATAGFVDTLGNLASFVMSSRDTKPVVLATVENNDVAANTEPGQSTNNPTSAATPTPAGPIIPFTATTDGFSRAKVTGPRSGVTQDIFVWTPPNYSPTDGHTYPVIVFLHGVPGSSSGTVDALKSAQAMSNAVASGAIPPAILVIPDLNADEQQIASPDCADIVGHAQVGTWIQDDIPQVIRANFPNASTDRQDWAISGLSSGAYCAGWTGIMRSDVYGSVAMLSAYDPPEFGGMSATPELRSENTLTTLLSTHPHHPLHLWVLGAQNDAEAYAVATAMPGVTPATDTIDTDTPGTGGHSWTLWSEKFPEVLAWWGSHLPERQTDKTATPTPTPTVSPTPSPVATKVSSTSHNDGATGRSSLDRILPLRAWWTIVCVWLLAVGASAGVVVQWHRPRLGRIVRPTAVGRHGKPARIACIGRPRVARQSSKIRAGIAVLGVILRVCAVLLSCLLVCIAVGLLANHACDVYGQWSEAWSDLGDLLLPAA